MAHGAQRAGLTLGVLALTIGSAIFAKELTGPARPIEPLAQLAAPAAPAPHEPTVTLAVKQLPAFDLDVDALSQPPASSDPTTRSTGADEAPDASLGQIRWFDGRPVRAARTIMLRVTAYSPDERSCGIFADGQTATLHSVWTNGFQLVAADTRLLPFGSLLTVPGYADDKIVPVLDRGGAIKGHRLDVLFPTHREAMKWGVRDVPVIVWEYADGQPAGDPRRKR
ncbi:MAG: 3D domain-containing protein [Planctomycetota bacterium]